jgi:hypothetical protein
MKRENIKKSFDIDGFKFYKTKNGVLRKAKLCTNENSQVISQQEFMSAWNKHYDLYYA